MGKRRGKLREDGIWFKMLERFFSGLFWGGGRGRLEEEEQGSRKRAVETGQTPLVFYLFFSRDGF